MKRKLSELKEAIRKDYLPADRKGVEPTADVTCPICLSHRINVTIPHGNRDLGDLQINSRMIQHIRSKHADEIEDDLD